MPHRFTAGLMSAYGRSETCGHFRFKSAMGVKAYVPIACPALQLSFMIPQQGSWNDLWVRRNSEMHAIVNTMI